MKTSNGLSLFIVYCGWKLNTMFGNKQQNAENMDVKKIVFSVPTVLYTEVLKRKIQYFAIIRVFIISQEWAFEYMHFYM